MITETLYFITTNKGILIIRAYSKQRAVLIAKDYWKDCEIAEIKEKELNKEEVLFETAKFFN